MPVKYGAHRHRCLDIIEFNINLNETLCNFLHGMHNRERPCAGPWLEGKV